MDGKRVLDLGQGSDPAENALKIDHPTETINLVDMLAKLAEGSEDPEAETRGHKMDLFLRDYVFRGLNNLKLQYGSPHIAHFRAADFLRVIARCNLLGVRINGVEIFNLRGQLVEVEIGERDSNNWCISLVRKYRRGKRSFCATYSVPDRVLSMPLESWESLDEDERLR